MRTRLTITTLLVLGSLAAHDRSANACTCDMRDRILPADGTTDVPTNTQLFVHVRRNSPFEPGELQLQTASGLSVELDVLESWGDREHYLRLASQLPLEPNTTYHLLVDRMGEVATLSTFTTGSAADLETPPFAGLQSLVAETMPVFDCWHSCLTTDRYGWYSRLRLSYDALAADVAYVIFEFRDALDLLEPSRQVIIPAEPFDGKRIDGVICGPTIAPSMTPWEDYCVKLTAYDLAGNHAGGDVELCTTAVECEQACGEYFEPSDECTIVPESEDPQLTDPPARTGGCGATPIPGPSSLLVLLPILLSVMPRQRRKVSHL